MNEEPDYRPVAIKRYVDMVHAFMAAPQADGRFTGTLAQERDLAHQMRRLFDGEPGNNPLRFKWRDVMGLANDLDSAQPHWSIGQYSASLSSPHRPGATMSARPIHEVFDKRARGIGHILQNRVPRFAGFKGEEKLVAREYPVGGGLMLIQFYRESDIGAVIEFGNVSPAGTGNTRYGPETILKAEDLGASSVTVDNRTGYKEIEVNFRDLFAKTDSKEKTASGGTSSKLTIEAEESIAGFGSIKESLEEEVHAEFAETEGSETTNEREGEEATIVPVGKRVKITETRQRADTELEATSNANFTFNLHVGQHDHRWNHGWRGKHGRNHFEWNSWDDFVDVIKGDAPSNLDLAMSFARHPANHADFWVLDGLDGDVKYKVRFEGKIIKDYSVHGVLNDGSFVPIPKDSSDG